MAVDTRDKRASALTLVWGRLVLPLADGTIDEPDRQHVAFCYRGITATSTVVTAYPDPFAATSSATLDPFAATSRYKGT